ncbi:deoxyribonuclease TATDN3-like [Tubulanus polymorphus]|uniref:deoxyribonuclease TATDN3-like n=1 Tax=Tubulanus polymorphus TaxID=672921 RepID=UPI003DA4EB12
MLLPRFYKDTSIGKSPKMFIDVHCHITAEEFNEDRDAVLTKAKEDAVTAILAVSESVADFKEILDLSAKYPGFIFPCLGLHPVQKDGEESRSVTEKELNEAVPIIEQYADCLFAIGEVGLDFTPRFVKSSDDKEVQRTVLRRQIELAKKYDLPLNVHSRSAGKPTIQLLKENGVTKAVLHAFDGRPAAAMEGVQCGYFFSIPPSIARSNQKSKLVERVPLENMLLETDSPALGPEKQVRNTPSNIRISCEYIASVKKVDVDTVKRITTENALKLFPKLRKFIKVV